MRYLQDQGYKQCVGTSLYEREREGDNNFTLIWLFYWMFSIMEMLCSIIHTSANSLQNYGWSVRVWRLWSDVTDVLFFVRSSTCTAATAASASVICAPASHTEAARRSSPSPTLPLIEEWPLTCRSASSSRVWAAYNDSEPTSTGSHTSIKHFKIFLSLLCLFTAVFLAKLCKYRHSFWNSLK